MSQTLCISDAAFEMLQKLARARGETPDVFLERLIAAANHSPFGPAYYEGQHAYELDDWLRHLGVSEEEIAEADADVDADLEVEATSDADA